MLQTVVAAKMAKDEKISKRIGGAPEWVQEFLQRIEDRDDVRAEVTQAEMKKIHDVTMLSLGDLAESVGKLGGAVSRVDKKVESLREELLLTRQDVAGHGTRLATLEKEIHGVHMRLGELNAKVAGLEEELASLQDQEG